MKAAELRGALAPAPAPMSESGLLWVHQYQCQCAWQNQFCSGNLDHVVTVHRVATATYELAQYIFLQELDNEDFNIVDHLNQGFFKESFIAPCLGDQSKPCSNNLKTANCKLINKHRHTFLKEIKFECPQLIGAAFVANYEGTTILAAYKSHVSQRFSGQLKHMVNIELDTSKDSKQINSKHTSDSILRDRVAGLIESFFGTYPEDYIFSDNGLKYDSVAKPVNHFGASVEMFRSLKLNEAVNTISLFPTRTSIVLGFTTLDKTILARGILPITKSRLKALHNGKLYLDIKLPEIPRLKDLKGKKRVKAERISRSKKGSGDADNNNENNNNNNDKDNSTSTSNSGKLANGANKRRERVFHWIRKNAKKVFQLDPAKLAKAETNGWYMSVEDTERALNHPGSSTLACKLYAEYLLERRKGDFVLGEHYHNTQTLGKSQKHAGSSSTDSLHRKFHYLSFVNRKRADPIRGKGRREMPIGQGFTVYLIDEYCTSTFCPVCESRIEKFHKIDDPCLKNPKRKYHVAMAAAAFNSVVAATTSAAASVAAAATDAAAITDSAQQSRNQWMPIRPESADIIRRIGEEKGWSKRKISHKIKQQLQNELAERNWEQFVNLQPADNLKRIARLSGWSRGKIERKIRQRMCNELAAQQQVQDQQQQQQCTVEDCLQTFRTDGTKIKDGEKVPSSRRKWNRDMAAVLNFRIILNALLKGEHSPCLLRKKTPFELAGFESTATPNNFPKPKP
ncbi:hypothetical protein BX661DRAFT_222000 [Kickxella alabastrina]|uniref:uncharacterized protein n=1 Tax=Kickxella alabastrina TaxID=61397 RepID=UPI00221EE1B2|nr:uncharacterized protein BX661DRAFT_222000 [Kickxella alabastrina]KAI7835116.1 hypothetical protein BX661DRAFT_222000 [Kickxella alabastrina]